MAGTITLFEHESVPYPWTDQDAMRVSRLNRALGADALSLVWIGATRNLHAHQYVGVIRLGTHTIQILPKMYRTDGNMSEPERMRAATQNLLYLLGYAAKTSVRESGIESLTKQSSDWFEILTQLFASHLREEWQRGANREYQVVEETLPVLRGKWLIGEQLRHPVSKHLFAVAHDEFQVDNPLNRVLRYVVEQLWLFTRDPKNRQMLAELRTWMEEVRLLPAMSPENAEALSLTRLNIRFEPVLNLARFFLRGWAPNMAIGRANTFAFVVDMNQVFEGFIVNFIRRHSEAILPEALHSADLLAQTAGATRYLAHAGGQQAFQLRPDLACRLGDQFPLLIDAKYKRLSPTETTAGVAQTDFFQMYAYIHRYHAKQVLLLYPQTAEIAIPLTTPFALNDGTGTIVAATIDLRANLGRATTRLNLINRLKFLLSLGDLHD